MGDNSQARQRDAARLLAARATPVSADQRSWPGGSSITTSLSSRHDGILGIPTVVAGSEPSLQRRFLAQRF